MLHYFTAILIIIFLSLIAYEDYKFSKIYNKRVLAIFLIGIGYFVCSLIWWWLGKNNDYSYMAANLPLFILSLKSLTVSLILSYILWHYQFWSAGDAKLFTVLSFSFPIYFYHNAIFTTLPALTLFTNIFFIPFLLVLFRFLFFPFYYGYFAIKNSAVIKKYQLKKPDLSVKAILNNVILFLEIVVLFIAYRIIRYYFGQYWGGNWQFDNYWFIGSYLLLMRLSHFSQTYFNKNKFLILLLTPIVIYFTVLFFKSNESVLSSLEILWHSLIWLIIFRIILYLYYFYEDFMEKKVVLVANLEPGMMIDTSIANSIEYKPLATYLENLDHLITLEEIAQLQTLWQEYEDSVKNAHKNYSVAKFFYLNKEMIDDEIISGFKIKNDKLLDLNYEDINNFVGKINTEEDLDEKNTFKLKTLIRQYYKENSAKDVKTIDLQIHKSVCFGIWFLVGIVITISLKTSLVLFIKSKIILYLVN